MRASHPRTAAGSSSKTTTTSSAVPPPQPQTSTTAEQRQFWAKGTGFGTGSTQSNFNAEELLKKRQTEEEHVSALLYVVSAYIDPSETGFNQTDTAATEADTMNDTTNTAELESEAVHMLSESCLQHVITSYLRNDSGIELLLYFFFLTKLFFRVFRSPRYCTSRDHLSRHSTVDSGDCQSP